VRRERLLYLAAGAAYIALGVFVPELLMAWPVGVAFLLLVVWLGDVVLRPPR
jgi:hypothetical protein